MTIYRGSLVVRTRELLLETQIPLRRVAKEVELEYQWLLLFKAGRIADPACSRIQRIYEFLTGKELSV